MKQIEKTLNNIIESTESLKCSSFQLGCALYKAIEEQRVNFDDLDAVYEEIVRRVGEDIVDRLERANLNTDVAALAGLLDISELDEIARDLIYELGVK